MTTVPILWPGGTVAILASGPSLTQQDVDYVRGKVDGVIVINTTYQLAPWADCLYGSDGSRRFWKWNKGLPEFGGMKYTIDKNPYAVPVLKNTGESGLEMDPTGLRTGKNSAYAAMNLSVHFGATRIVLLGLDMAPGPKRELHWHPDHPDRSAPPFALCLGLFQTIVEPLKTLGVEVINCSRRTVLTCFPQQRLEDVL